MNWRRLCLASFYCIMKPLLEIFRNEELSTLWGGPFDFWIPLIIRKVFPNWQEILAFSIVNPLFLILFFSRVTRISLSLFIHDNSLNKSSKAPVLLVKQFKFLNSCLVGITSIPALRHPFFNPRVPLLSSEYSVSVHISYFIVPAM